MVWIRRVRTASGATAVQIMESVGGKRRVVRHVGSARDEAELGLLFAQAQRLVRADGQGELDLGLTPMAPKVSLVQARAEGVLFDHLLEPQAKRLVTAPQVLKTSSRLLYEAIAGVYDEVGFDVLDDETFRDLVIARIVEPTNLLDVDRVLADLGRVAASLRTRQRTLKRCFNGDYRGRLAEVCFSYAQACGNISLILYDVTTLCSKRRRKTTCARSATPRNGE